MRSRYKVLDPLQIYFITSSIVEWIPVFVNRTYFNILIDSIKYCQEKKGLRIHGYVLLDNHFHMIVSNNKLSSTIASLKRNTAKEIIEQLKIDKNKVCLQSFELLKPLYKNESIHQIWQEGFHPQMISTGDMLEQKLNYIHFNPVRRGLVSSPEEWIYSSAPFYSTGAKGLLEVDILNF